MVRRIFAGLEGHCVRDTDIIARLIAPSIEGMGFRLVRVSFGGGNRPVLQIMAEPADGTPMTVEHCTDLSGAVSAILDVEDPIQLAYTLEVTSPGIDRPLISRSDFSRFAGFETKLELSQAFQGRKRFRGRLVAGTDPDIVLLAEEGVVFTLPFADILKAKLVLTDDLLEAAGNRTLPPPAQDEPAPV